MRHAGEFYSWDGTRYVEIPDDEVRSVVYPFLAAAMRRTQWGLNPFQPNTAKVSNVMDALRAEVHLPSGLVPPTWIRNAADRAPATEILAAANGLVQLPSGLLIPHTPEFFSTHALPFAFDAAAPPPVEWEKFLSQIFSHDPAAILTLQEFMGYSLTPDTRQQKILLIIGPPRSGKGTIGRVWAAMLGPWGVAAPTLASLETNFGMSPLVGKLLALISDARLSGRADQAKVVERLLSISGEDFQTIDRKFLDPWTGRLGVRIVILTNELPRLADSSGAMASRFIVLVLRESFLGREDPDLEGRLLAELPGILRWSMEGRQRLRERGRFLQPDSAADVIRDLMELSSPIKTFIDDCCDRGSLHREQVAYLYAAWCQWCDSQGREHPGTIQTFGRDLKAAVPDIGESRPRDGKDRVRFYTGIRLRPGGPHWSAVQPNARESGGIPL